MAGRAFRSVVDTQACSSTMAMLALLAISSSLLATPAAAHLGSPSFNEPAAYSFGEPGSYALADPGAYTLAGFDTPGAYSFAQGMQPGGYSFAEPGAYSFGTHTPTTSADNLARTPAQQLLGQQRRLLAVGEVTVPASVPASSSEELGLDIVPAELPAGNSWDSKSWQSWEEWYSQHFNSHPDVGGAGTYGMSVAGDYRQGSYGNGGYGGYGGNYGSEGAYFDFRSNRAFVPEQAADVAEPAGTVLPAGSLVSLPSSASGAGARLRAQQLHMAPRKHHNMAAASQGRGLTLGLTRGQEAAAAAAEGSFSGQANLVALNLQQPGPARRLLAKAADALWGLAHSLRLSEAAAAPEYFARRLHMARSS